MAKKSTPSFEDMLMATETVSASKPKAKKSAEILPVPEDIQAKIDSYLKAKKEKKVAESNMTSAESPIIEYGLNQQEMNAFSGNFNKSFKIGNPENNINFVTANKFSFKQEDVGEIKEILGESADDLILTTREVKLKSEVFSNEELKKKFMELVGGSFPEFFETVVTHSVVEDFDAKIYKLGKEAVDDLKVYMKKSKPSLR